MSDHTWGDADDDDRPSDLDALSFGYHQHDAADDDDSPGPLVFGVTNPAGTITAQATISGAIRQIELSPSASSMTESDLARDIMTTANLANLQGRVIQRGLIQGLLMNQGVEADAAEQYIDNIADLPTPARFETAQAEAAAAYLRNAHTDRW